jgi:predicted kinase
MDINTPERQALREELADKNYGTGAVNKNKRLDLVIGPPAAGKTSTLVGPLAQKYGSIVLDSDAIKKQLPEFNKGVGSAATHDESAYISDDLMSRKAMKAGDNIVAARLGKNASTMQQYMDFAKSKGYDVHLHDMSLPADKAAARAATRFSETGQFVDPHYILNSVGDKTDFVYNKVKKEATTYGQYNADVPRGETPKLIDSSPGYEQPLRPGRTVDAGSNQVHGGEPNSPGTIKVQRTPSQAQRATSDRVLDQEAQKSPNADSFIESVIRKKVMDPASVKVGDNIHVANRDQFGNMDHLTGTVTKVDKTSENGIIVELKTPEGKTEQTAIKDGDNYVSQGIDSRTVTNADLERTPQELEQIYNDAKGHSGYTRIVSKDGSTTYIPIDKTPQAAQSIKVAQQNELSGMPKPEGPFGFKVSKEPPYSGPNLNETAFDPADLVKISKADPDTKSVLYDPRSLSTQRGESGEPGVPTQTEDLKGADLHYKPDQRAPMSDEELSSLAKNAPVPTMEEILAKRGANMTPEPTNASDRLNESDAQVHELLSGGGKRSEAIAYYVEHHDMSKAQATHRVNIVQREVNLHRGNPNPVIDKYVVQHGSPEDTHTPVYNTREIHNNVTTQLQKVNDLSNELDKHDGALLDLHSKDPAEIAKQAHDPEAFLETAKAFKDLNDITHAYGFNMGQPLPYRQQYGSRLIFDLEDPESREAFMKVATPTDKGYTLPRTIKDYDEAAKYGIKRKNANAVEDINQDAQERISDLKKLALQQGLEDAYPGKVAVGQIGRDAEDGKIYKELSIPNGAHLSMPSDIADKINERSRIETAPDLGVPRGHIKGAVAKSIGMSDEVKSQFNRMHEAQAKLSENDQRLLYLYDNGAKLDDLKPDNATRFNTAVTAMQKALDATAAAREQVTGLKSLRPQNELPQYFEATPERMDELQIPERDRLEDYPGFQDSHGQYNSYLQAFAKDQLKPLFKNPFEAAEYFGGKAAGGIKNQALFTTLAHAAPDDIAERGVRTTDETGKPFSQAAGRLPFDVSKKLDKSLGGLREAWEPKTAVGRGAEGSIKIAGKVTKASLWLGSFFHYSNLAKNIVGLDGISGHPVIAGKGLGQALEDSVSKGGYEDLIDHYRETGTLQSARDMGIVLSDGKKALSRYEDANVLALVDAAKKNGVDPNSPEGTDLGRIYNAVLGRRNSAVEASNPTIEKFLNYTTLAPHYMTTQLRLMADALLPKKYGGAGYDKPISLYTPGGAARGTVVGARLFEAATAITLGIILTHKFPNPKQLAQEAGLYANNPTPNVPLNSKNSKGESQVMNLPTDQMGLIFGLLTDPKHFFQSRFSPIGTFGTSLITNENWNEQPLTTPGQPNALGTKIVHAAENAFTPIGVQNFTNLQNNPNNASIRQGIAEEFGGRLKTNPNDPQVKANSAYFSLNSSITKTLTNGQFSQLDPSLKDVSWQQAQQFVNTFNSLHPTNTTSATGQKFPQDYNASSAEVKYNAYTMTDPTSGARVLSPVYYADKKLENGTPGYPSSPLYKLSGTGTDVDGQKAPQALVALEYQHQQDPAAKTDILNANGGQKGWLSNYETKLGNYDQNYQKNMTSYFQSLGWTPKAVNTYWSNHPSMPDPIEAVNFPQSTTNLMNTYSTMAANDPTSAAQFFTQHSQVLGDAFDLEAQHSNALRKASGELEIQGYPTETPQVTKLLNSMPTGSTTADKSARSAIINDNPAVNQFLADSALYESLSKGAQFRYVNPASPSKTEGQNVNAGGQAGQTFLKDTSSLGSYDIGENKTTGQYSFMQGGGFPAGSASTAASSSTSDGPLIAMPGYPKKPPRHSAGKLRLQKERAKTIRIRKANLSPVQILHGGGPLHASNVIHIAK